MIVVDLSRRLPDVNTFASVPADLDAYGRCAVVQSGRLWVGGLYSSHPTSTVAGFYWATTEIRSGGRGFSRDGHRLYVSARTVVEDLARYVNEAFVKELARRVGLCRCRSIHWEE